MNKILILIGAVLLLAGVFSCSEESLKSEEGLLPFDPDAGKGKLDNAMWAWIVTYPGEVGSMRERLDDVSVLVKGGYVLNTSLNVASKPKYWQISGLYVPPAEEIEITVPSGVNNLHYYIGVASIELPKNTANLKRFNTVVDSGRLDPDFNVVSHNFGGHLYFCYEGTPTASDITVTVNGAVKSPDFILGQSNLEAWTADVQDTLNPMIWGELIGKNIAITLPIKELRKIKYPSGLITEYDGFVEKLGKLWGGNFDVIDGIPLWRVYADIQLPGDVVTISGYPTGLNMEKEEILTELINIIGLTSAKSKLIINALGKNNLTPWYTSDILSPLIPQLSTYYLYNLEDQWPLDVANLTERPNIKSTIIFSKLDEKFRMRMLLQLAQEYGWGLYTYLNTALNDELSTSLRDKGDNQEILQQIKNDLFAMTVSEYVGINLTDFFKHWHFPISAYGSGYMAKFDSSRDSIWKEFNRVTPEIDKKLTPIKHDRGDPMLIKDTIYNPSEWNALASSEHPKAGLAKAALDGDNGSHWHNNWEGSDADKSFPHYLHFNFDKKEAPEHELEFNYVMLRPSTDGRAHMRPKKFIIEVLDGGAWISVDDGREFYIGNVVEDQIFYLNKPVTAKGVKITMINSQNDADHVIDPPKKEGCLLAEFRIGLIK